MKKDLTTKKELDEVAEHPLQTWAWGEFRKAAGNEVVRFPFGQLTLHKLPLTNYKIGMFIKGPIPTADMLSRLKSFAQENNVIFVKMEPNYVVKKDNIACADRQKAVSLLKKFGAVPGKTLFTPTTFWIDLTKSEVDLLKSFHHKTRYNIKIALKNRVEVKEDNSDKAFKKYLQLTQETVERQGFYAHTKRYHELMWEYLHKLPISNGQLPIARLLTAKYKNEIVTTWILFVWKDFLYYPYGASTHEYKNIMANNLMLWEAIRLGKNLGLKTFDLWGREEGKGFTKFKEGYNPAVIEFLGTWDLVINQPMYYLYRLAETARWFALRLQAKLGLAKYRF